MNMQRLILLLTLTILLVSCRTTGVCPPFPYTPEPVKEALRGHYDDPLFKHWVSDLSRLKKKLEVCR